MNLLLTVQALVEEAGGSMPLEVLAERIKFNKKIRKTATQQISLEQLKEVIQTYGKNLNVTHDQVVENVLVSESRLSSTFWRVTEALRLPENDSEVASIGLLFYAKVAHAGSVYNMEELELMSLKKLMDVKWLKERFLSEFSKLNNHHWFGRKLTKLIAIIEEIREQDLREAFTFIEDWRVDNYHITPQEFAYEFENLFYYLEQYRNTITYMPEFIRELITGLVITRPFSSVYNPILGIGESFTSIQTKADPFHKVKYTGETMYSEFAFLAAMNLVLHQFPRFDIRNDNRLLSEASITQQMDCVICQPPFAGSSSTNDWQLRVNYLRFGRSSRMEVLYLQYVLSVLNEKGRAFIILPENFMLSENVTDVAIRKYLLENDFVDTVVSLPIGVYEWANIKTNLLVLDKHKTLYRKGKVVFYDTLSTWATAFDKAMIQDLAHRTAQSIIDGRDHEMVRETISVDEITKNKFRLQVSLYVNNLNSTLRRLRADDEHIVKLRDIVTSMKFGNYNREFVYPYIKGGNLSKDPSEPMLASAGIEKTHKQSTGKLIDASVVLLARVGNALNPTLFKFQGEPVVLNANVYALHINESIADPEYLVHELRSELVQGQLSTKRVGTAQLYYRYEDLLEIYIRLPDLKEQRRRLNLYKEQLLKEKRKEAELLEERLFSREGELTILSAMKHSFAQLPFKSDLSNLQDYLRDIEQSGKNFRWDDAISQAASARSVSEVFTGLHRMVNDTNALFQNMENLIHCVPEKMVLEAIKVHNFIKEVLIEMPETADVVSYFEGRNLAVQVDKYQFKELIRNLVINACRHGFSSDNSFPKMLIFRCDFETGGWTLSITNSGNLLPDGFTLKDYISFGGRGQAKKGSGIGGYLIHKVVTNHGGKLSIMNRPKNINFIKDKSEDSEIVPINSVEVFIQFPLNTIRHA